VIHHADRYPTTPADARRRSWQRALAVLARLAAVRPGLFNGEERRFAASLSPGQEASLRRRCDRGMGVPGDRHARSGTAGCGRPRQHAP
jgi:hypothetical protein